jgi:hypothetical protein
MQQKYLYSYNTVWNFLRGFFLFRNRSSQRVTAGAGQSLVWRNYYLQGFKIGEGYAS